MISLRKTATELDRLEELSRTALACYGAAIHSAENHAIEIDPLHSARFRSQLRVLNERLKAGASNDELNAVRASFDAEMKDYQKTAREQIERLRKDFAAAAAALEALAKSVASNGTDLDQDLNRQLAHLKRAAASNDLQEIRSEVHVAVNKIATSVQSMHVSNQMAIAQMKDEIRLLHEEVKAARGSKPADSAAGAAGLAADGLAPNRMVAKFTAQNRPFSALLAVVENLSGLRMLYPPNAVENGLCSFESRFRGLLPGAVVERRGRHQFIAILDADPKDVIAMSGELAKKLSLPIVEVEKGVSHTLRLAAGVGVLEFKPGTDPGKFESKLEQLAQALSGQH